MRYLRSERATIPLRASIGKKIDLTDHNDGVSFKKSDLRGSLNFCVLGTVRPIYLFLVSWTLECLACSFTSIRLAVGSGNIIFMIGFPTAQVQEG